MGGNENGDKKNKTHKLTVIGLISKKATLHVQQLFCTFLCRCFARLLSESLRNFF